MAYSNYCYELYHKGLNRTKIIKAATQEELIIKVAEMRKKWDAEWNVQQSVQYANRVTSEANQLHIDIDNILTGTLPVKILNFEGMKNYDDFSVKAPLTPKYIKPTARPEREDEMYNPSVPLLVRLSKKRTAEFVCKCDAAYKADLEQWNKSQEFIKAENAHMERKYKQELEDWNKQREEYSLKRDEYNKSITEFSRAFFRGEKWAVEKYIQMVLEDKKLPFMFDRTVDVEYDKEEKLLIIDLLLPAIEEMPNVKSYSYIKARSEYKETHYSESDMKKKTRKCCLPNDLAGGLLCFF